MPNIETCKRYLYMDPLETDDAILTACMSSAQEYLLGAGVAPRESALYDLAVYMLSGHWYENRGIATLGTATTEISHTVQALIHQLRG